MQGNVLVTGGAGFIGSHTCVELIESGYAVTVIDNLANSDRRALHRVETITGCRIRFEQVDIRDRAALDRLLGESTFEAVVHFAGLKAVGESVARPLDYYEINVVGTVTLLQAMQRVGLRTLVFSSSATVYGDPTRLPIDESSPRHATNPYGRSKLVIEHILEDLHASDPSWRIARLRYFNPVGAHESGLIGENPLGVPNNLMPYIAQVACGRRERLAVFGDDYPTPDGTGVRDYIHVVDLAKGHLSALAYLGQQPHGELVTVNLGTGRGVSVFELLREFEQACGRSIPFDVTARRPGDVAACYADPSLAERLLGWKAEKSVREICADTWRWQSVNPLGYASCSSIGAAEL
jgi:UDP-glucose 4-epimerase